MCFLGVICVKWTSLNELREKFLTFFESKGHLKLDSFSLVPSGDKSLLLINSGMAPMKKYFTGEVTPPSNKVTTCQKCIRTPDIERVGITARHGTYFEMLGNFSFGDYFKKEATAWAWEFCTKVLELPENKLWVSIYEEDDEAFDIWTKNVGVDPSHIVRLGKADNFWEHGAGPCGPASEIYFDRGEKYGCGSPDCKVGCDCDRYIEFWNLVFTQFENDGHNNYTRLEHPNIDTGMGLERLACIMQGVDNLFLVDTVQNIMRHVSGIAGVRYGDNAQSDVSLRVITDHIRSVTFMIGDGVMPSNEGRGYVLRRLLRRAARHGRLLGITEPFLAEVCATVIKENERAYPELLQKRDLIQKLIRVEEEGFAKTIDQGLELLNDAISELDGTVLSGEVAFKLNDTFGFPLDLTKEILSERGLTVDEARFEELLAEQKNRARAARTNAGAEAWANGTLDFSQITPTKFVGYDNLTSHAQILAIIKDGCFVEFASEGEKVTVILDESPFYAQSGGQVGDSGELIFDNAVIKVSDTTKNSSGVYMHEAMVSEGVLKVGTSCQAKVNATKRARIMRNHTAAHLLQAALRQVLGTHVEQAGQLVDENRVRFDFTHFSALTNEKIKKVEDLVNEEILRAEAVLVAEMPIDEAKKIGAMALFGEKYGKVVRVVRVGDFSVELCGGTHAENTAQLGVFKILSEASVAAGVRRIEAVTSLGVLEVLSHDEKLLEGCQKALKVNQLSELVNGCEAIMSQLKEHEKTITKLNSQLACLKVEELINSAYDINGTKVIIAALSGLDNDALKSMCDVIKSKVVDSVAVILSRNGEKSSLIVSAGSRSVDKGANAGALVKEIAKLLGGNGGGRKDMAMAGVKEPEKFEQSREQILKILERSLSS